MSPFTRAVGSAARLILSSLVIVLVGAEGAYGCERHVAPFFRGTGGFVAAATDGRSVEVTVRGSDANETGTLHARSDGLVVELLRSSLCVTSGGNPVECRVTFSGIEGGGWYWVNGDRNAAVAPLVCEDDLGGVAGPFDPGGVQTSRSRFGTGTLFVHDTQGLMGIIPHLSPPASGGCERQVAPFFRGRGGFVAKPDGGQSLEVGIQRGRSTVRRTLYPRSDGLVVQLLTDSLCADAGGEAVECEVWFTGVEDGGWYWVNGNRNSAVAPLVCEEQLSGGARALDPGGVQTTRSGQGTGSLFVHNTQGLMGIIPHLSGAAGGPASDADPGSIFSDPLSSGGMGPEMVVIPAGSFQMGCVSGVVCYSDEHPVHDVTIPQYAVGRFEVTFAEWDACVSAGGCGPPPEEVLGHARRPVVGVSWEDAKSYLRWLSQQTGASYRLLSESEWEYAARAGSSTAYSWGNEIGSGRANCDGCGSQWDDSRTAPVGSFFPNAFGLYDMHGNVDEWVEDCWVMYGYETAPADGSAWLKGDCSARRLRGGSWGDHPRKLRSAYREASSIDSWSVERGFRVARTLSP